jgi:TolA-binding protein
LNPFGLIRWCTLVVCPFAFVACGGGQAQVQNDLVEVRKELRGLNEAYKVQSRRLNDLQDQLALVEDRLEAQQFQRQAARVPAPVPAQPQLERASPPTPELPPATITQADLDALAGPTVARRRRVRVRRAVAPPANARAAGNIGVRKLPSVQPAVGGPDGTHDDPLYTFKSARARLRSGDVPGGIEALRQFAATSPRHSYADNALVLVGKAQFERAQFAAALQTFRTVLKRFPTGNQVPDALLMTGLTLKKLGRVAEGRDTLGRLRAIYPDSAAAKRAASEMARAQGPM